MKLRTKIQIFLSLIMVLVIILINTAVYFLFYNLSLDTEMERVQSDTNTIMEALAADTTNDTDTNQLLRAYIPSDGMIRVINQEEEVIHAVSRQAEYYDLPIAFYQSETVEVVRDAENTRFIIISNPLIWENGEVMTLQVAEHLVPLEETMSTLLIVLLAASLLMILPAIIAGGWLGNIVTKPIRQLTNSMIDNPKNGKWEKIKLESKSEDELYQMGATYNQMIDRLNESFAKQEQFISDASHELKTPIAVIKSYTQLLSRWGKEKPEVFEEAVHTINGESSRMQFMTEQMLALARNQTQENLQFEKVNMIGLIQDVIRSLSVAYNRKIILFSSLSTFSVSVDRVKINQALYILIDNACKYSDDEIHVKIEQTENGLKVKVQDFGEGIKPDDLEHIFDRFYRVDRARSRKTGGTGLGLPIALSVVRAHGGDIKVKSEPEKGSEFTIYLPN